MRIRYPQSDTPAETATSLAALTLDTSTPAPLCGKADVMRYLGASRSYVDRLLASGVLPAVKLGRAVRVRLEDLHRYAASLPAATYPGRD